MPCFNATRSYSMSLILHNPKSHAPAIYIPCWLSQVSTSALSISSKVVYGRLAQWATNNGKAHRSVSQLSEETGIPVRTVGRSIKELKENGLIGTHQITDGGHNHYEFYHHKWMDKPIVNSLCYKDNIVSPYANMAVPHANMAVPHANMAVHKIKEIKEIKEPKDIPDFANRGKKKVVSDYKKDERFMSFYSAYPKKQDPRDAWKAFKTIVGDNDSLLQQIIEDINLRKTTHTNWQNRQYIKYPATYLLKGEYLSEIYNAEQEKDDKRAEAAEQARERTAKQDAASQQRAENERFNNARKISDAPAFQAVVRHAPSKATENALSGLRALLN